MNSNLIPNSQNVTNEPPLQDSYGIPQGSPLPPRGNSAPSSSSAPDSYGIPQGSPVAPQPAQSASAPNGYGIPQVRVAMHVKGYTQAEAKRTARGSLRRHIVASTEKKSPKKGQKIAKIGNWRFFGPFLAIFFGTGNTVSPK